MSRQRSRSPHYRRFLWEEPDLDPHEGLVALDRDLPDRRESHEERLDFFRSQRRSPPFSDDRPLMHHRHSKQQDFYQKQPSPHYSAIGFVDHQRLSPVSAGGRERHRRRGGSREHLKGFENRASSPKSPLRSPRDSLPPTMRSNTDHQQRESEMGWRREEQGRGRFRDLGPSGKLDEQRGRASWGRGRSNTQRPNGERQREDSRQEKSPPFKSQRREMDNSRHLGYRIEETGEQRYSPRDRFGGETQERHLGPLIIEHDHGITPHRDLSRWEQFDERRDRNPGIGQDSPGPRGSSQEQFRTSESRSDGWEDARGQHFQDNWRPANYPETRRSTSLHDRPNTMRYGSHRERAAFQGKVQDERTGPHRNQPHIQQSSQRYQALPHEEQRLSYQPFRAGNYGNPMEEKADWPKEARPQQWRHDRPESLEQHLPNVDLDPKVPHQWKQGENDQKTKNMSVITEETLTIKVDMTRPVDQNSSLCYSSDRQLSLDLVNVGRQRLDFLPMLEHSGMFHETAMHTGTFAQEVITLVHRVKELYFGGSGITLNERFSAPQTGGYSEDKEAEELTLDRRFSSNRGFSLNMNSLLDDDEPLVSRQGPLQPVRGPGDLRHNLERRRQERLEGVKVTITGNNMPQHHLSPVSEPGLEYRDGEEKNQMERRKSREGYMGPRRGGSYRPFDHSQRRNNRFGNRYRQARRQNNYNTPTGPN